VFKRKRITPELNKKLTIKNNRRKLRKPTSRLSIEKRSNNACSSCKMVLTMRRRARKSKKLPSKTSETMVETRDNSSERLRR
jgi:hypothetical protein